MVWRAYHIQNEYWSELFWTEWSTIAEHFIQIIQCIERTNLNKTVPKEIKRMCRSNEAKVNECILRNHEIDRQSLNIIDTCHSDYLCLPKIENKIQNVFSKLFDKNFSPPLHMNVVRFMDGKW